MIYSSRYPKLIVIGIVALLVVSCSSKKSSKKDNNDPPKMDTLDSAYNKGLVNYQTSSGSILTPLKSASDYNKLSSEDKASAQGVNILDKAKLLVVSAESDIVGEIDFSNFYLADKVKYKLYNSYSFESNEISLSDAVAIDQIDASLASVKLIMAQVSFTALDSEGNPTGTASGEDNFFDNAKSETEKWQFLIPSYYYPHIAYIKKTPETVLPSLAGSLSYTGNVLVSLSSIEEQVRSVDAVKKFENVKLNVALAGAIASVTTEELDLGSDFYTLSGNTIQYIKLEGLKTGNNADEIILSKVDQSQPDITKGIASKVIFGGDKAQEIGITSVITIPNKLLAINAVGSIDPVEDEK